MPENSPLQKSPLDAATQRKSAKGCLMAVVITVVVGVAVLLFGGYYAVFHSSWPLRMVASAINETGKMQVKGLQGTFSTGFTADEFRIFQTGLTDTYFTNISFKYNGMSDVSNQQRLIVDEFIIGKAFISLPELKPSGSGESLDANLSELDNLESAEELEQTGSLEIREFRIDEFVIQNPDGEEKSGSVLLKGFKADHTDMQIAELRVTGDYLEMKLENLPATNRFRQAVRGVVKAAIHQTIRQDIDFSLEFGGEGNAKQAAFAMFDGKLKGRQRGEEMTTEYQDLSLSEFLDPALVNLPDDLNLKVVTKNDGRTTEVSAGAFRIGSTKFNVAPQTLEKRGPNALVATAEIRGQAVTLRIPDVEDSARMKYEFSSDGMALPDIVAQVLFGKNAAELEDEAKQQAREFARHHKIDLEVLDWEEPAPAAVATSTNKPAKQE